MLTFIETLARDGILLCPSCRQHSWRIAPEVLSCQGCGADWPIRNRVPDLFNRYQPSPAVTGAEPPAQQQELVAAIVKALELDPEGEMPARVAEIVARASSWACDDNAYTAEINDLLDRFAPSPAALELGPAPAPCADPSLRLERHYLPPVLAAGSRQSANIRVTNCGTERWSSRMEAGLELAARWLDGDTELGGEPMRTRFPIDIAPGRSISLPLPIVAPETPGRYRLRVQLQRLDTGEAVGAAFDLDIETAASVPPAPGLETEPEVRPQIVDYGEDHAAGTKLIEAALKDAGIERARILEVGSGTHPHTAWLTDHEVLALDISSPLLELGSLYFGDRFHDRLGFVCADAFNAPFAAGQFDLVCMFSALHHFQEPEVVLRQLSALLKDGGQLAVMCEPVGDSLEQPETIRDLLKGINEQVFTVAEYGQIFAAAGLTPERIQIDGASLKALLRCRRA